eukprot:gb/GECH01008522.1/.p1 GENE.gb/GECH01008522.1/~~gb/GECH01008522.1/.p1  ORF type:complete len:464 (+),score=43.06 gb/GECH01008522.1/:1-1392(+)
MAIVPVDKYNVSTIIFAILGTGVLIPWNAMIAATDFFILIYPGIHFEFIMSIIYMGGNFSCLFPVLRWGSRFKVSPRIITGFSLYLFLLLVIPILACFNITSSFFALVITLISAAFAGMVNSTLESTVYGLAAMFGKRQLQAVQTGTGISGILSTLIRMITKLAFPPLPGGEKARKVGIAVTDPNLIASAVLFFILGATLMIVCIVCFLILQNTSLYRYLLSSENVHVPEPIEKDKEEERETKEENVEMTIQDDEYVMNSDAKDSENYNDDNDHMVETSPSSEDWRRKRTVNYSSVLRKKWISMLSVYLVFLITLSLFPGLISEIEQTTFSIPNGWFPIILILLFNVCDFSTKITANRISISPKILLILTISRVVFFPLLLFCVHPYLFHHIMIPISIVILFGLSNGFCVTHATLLIPSGLSPPEQEISGMMFVTLLISGLTSGALIGFLITFTLPTPREQNL